jgi:hypothetical protein
MKSFRLPLIRMWGANWITGRGRTPSTDSPLTFRTDGLGRPAQVTLVYYRIAHEHCNLYWRIVGA